MYRVPLIRLLFVYVVSDVDATGEAFHTPASLLKMRYPTAPSTACQASATRALPTTAVRFAGAADGGGGGGTSVRAVPACATDDDSGITRPTSAMNSQLLIVCVTGSSRFAIRRNWTRGGWAMALAVPRRGQAPFPVKSRAVFAGTVTAVSRRRESFGCTLTEIARDARSRAMRPVRAHVSVVEGRSTRPSRNPHARHHEPHAGAIASSATRGGPGVIEAWDAIGGTIGRG